MIFPAPSQSEPFTASADEFRVDKMHRQNGDETVSRKYLPLYVAEFQFRYNNRQNADIFGEAIRGC
jgi:hypothetical protein